MSKQNVQIMLSLKNWAVVGATQDQTKFGYKVMKKLLNHGYKVYPVNPNYNEIDGIKCYKTIDDIEEKIDVVNMIVNPRLGLNTIEAAFKKGIQYIWCQPGASNDELIKKAEEIGLILLPSACVLVELG